MHMRGVKALIAGTALFGALVAMAQPSFAEGLLRRLFGGFVERLPEVRFNFGRMGPPPPGYGGDSMYDNGGFEEDYGTYRTLCVRLCDGFYFPIGDGVRRERLYADARACTQRCDGEARLFYYPTNGGSVETMVDMSGHPYASLPNAFRYRKALVEGCACKPAPWSAEAAARHQGYAAEAGAQAAQAAQADEGRRFAGQPTAGGGAGGVEGYLLRESDGPKQTPWDGGVRRY
jgi:hypothetical protein